MRFFREGPILSMSLIVTLSFVAVVINAIDARDGLRSPASQRVTVDAGTPMLAAKCDGSMLFWAKYLASVMPTILPRGNG